MARIFLRKNVWYLDYTVGKTRIRKPIGKNKKIAELALADITLKTEKSHAGLTDQRIPIPSFFSDTRDRISRMSPRSAERYSEVLHTFEIFLQQDKLRFLHDIDTTRIDAFARIELARGLMPQTVNYELRLLHGWFLNYVRQGQLAKSPVQAVQRFYEKPKVPRFLTSDEIEKLFQHITPRFKPFFITLLYTGVRKNELLTLEFSDVFNDAIHIRPKIDWRPKSAKAVRSIPMHPEVVMAIADRRALHESEQLIFSNRTGGRLTKNYLYITLRRAAQKAGIPGVNIHVFRHTFASHLVQQGVSIYIVSNLLGHHSVTQTEIYAHLAPSPNLSILSNNLNFATNKKA